MRPIAHLHENYLDVLADACEAVPSNKSDVHAVVLLAKSALRVGSHIDVFCKGFFWEAEIIDIRHERFRYQFLNTGDRREGGWVSEKDFIRRWRFPVRDTCDMWNARLIAGCGGL
jgi:hypothetical protein